MQYIDLSALYVDHGKKQHSRTNEAAWSIVVPLHWARIHESNGGHDPSVYYPCEGVQLVGKSSRLLDLWSEQHERARGTTRQSCLILP